MQADSELRSTRAQIPSLQHQIAQQENALSLLLGANPGAVKRNAFAQLTLSLNDIRAAIEQG